MSANASPMDMNKGTMTSPNTYIGISDNMIYVVITPKKTARAVPLTIGVFEAPMTATNGVLINVNARGETKLYVVPVISDKIKDKKNVNIKEPKTNLEFVINHHFPVEILQTR